MSRRKSKGGSINSGNEWISTYSDVVTLLLTFFVFLYSFSSVDAQKFKNIAQAFQYVMGSSGGPNMIPMESTTGDSLIPETIKQEDKELQEQTEDIYKKVQEFIKSNGLDSSIQADRDIRGVVIQLRDNILFESGKADFRPGSQDVMEKMNTLISSFPNKIVVEGHTDNVPMKTSQFDSNWELSTARAVNVLRYFVESRKQDPARFTAAGYGEFRPVADNNTPENRAKNRRVSILILAEKKENSK